MNWRNINLFSFDIILDSLHILSDGDDNGSDHVLYFQRSVKELDNPTRGWPSVHEAFFSRALRDFEVYL